VRLGRNNDFGCGRLGVRHSWLHCYRCNGSCSPRFSDASLCERRENGSLSACWRPDREPIGMGRSEEKKIICCRSRRLKKGGGAPDITRPKTTLRPFVGCRQGFGAFARRMQVPRRWLVREQGLRANNRAERLRRLLRRRERTMQGFKSVKSAQRFVSVHAAVYNIFNAQRHFAMRQLGSHKPTPQRSGFLRPAR
jgi:hypothetical protein